MKPVKQDYVYSRFETFEKCSISFKFKEGENFNHRNTLNISVVKTSFSTPSFWVIFPFTRKAN